MPNGDVLTEAIEAARRGQRARARDLLTRVLRSDQANEQAWLWMSAVVDTEKERIYCLQSVLKINPGHPGARYGLVLLGVLPPDEYAPAVTRTTGATGRTARSRSQPAIRRPRSRRRVIELAILAIVGVVTVLVLGAAVLAFFRFQAQAQLAASFTATPTSSPTASVTPTLVPSSTPSPTATPTSSGATPLAAVLGVTVTPTSLYFVTPHPEEAYGLGLKAYQAGRWNDVISFMSQALAANKNLYEAYFFLGEAYHAMDKLREARQQFTLGLDANSSYAPFYLGRGRTRLAQNQAAGALADYDQATQLDPNWVEPYLRRAEYYRSVGDLKRGRAELDAAKGVSPDNAVVLWRLAQILADQGQTDRALVEISHAFEIDPTIVDVYGVRGYVLLLKQQYPQALADLSTYLAYAPRDASGYYRRAQARAGLSDVQAALDDLTKALALQPSYSDALLLRAGLNLEAVRYDEAVADYTAAIGVRDSAEARVGRGRVYLAQGLDDSALVDLRRAVDLSPRNYQANLWLGQAAIRNKLYTQAIDPLTAALEGAATDAERFEAIYWRAQTFQWVANEARAVEDWRLMLALPVDDPRQGEAVARLQALDAYTPAPTFTPPPAATGSLTPIATPAATPTVRP